MDEAQNVKIPEMIVVTATEFQNNFSKYRKKARNGEEILITVGGKEEYIMKKAERPKFSSLAGSLTGKITHLDAKDVGEMKRINFLETGHI